MRRSGFLCKHTPKTACTPRLMHERAHNTRTRPLTGLHPRPQALRRTGTDPCARRHVPPDPRSRHPGVRRPARGRSPASPAAGARPDSPRARPSPPLTSRGPDPAAAQQPGQQQPGGRGQRGRSAAQHRSGSPRRGRPEAGAAGTRAGRRAGFSRPGAGCFAPRRVRGPTSRRRDAGPRARAAGALPSAEEALGWRRRQQLRWRRRALSGPARVPAGAGWRREGRAREREGGVAAGGARARGRGGVGRARAGGREARASNRRRSPERAPAGPRLGYLPRRGEMSGGCTPCPRCGREHPSLIPHARPQAPEPGPRYPGASARLSALRTPSPAAGRPRWRVQPRDPDCQHVGPLRGRHVASQSPGDLVCQTEVMTGNLRGRERFSRRWRSAKRTL